MEILEGKQREIQQIKADFEKKFESETQKIQEYKKTIENLTEKLNQ